jgi:periplasmic protein TonB
MKSFQPIAAPGTEKEKSFRGPIDKPDTYFDKLKSAEHVFLKRRQAKLVGELIDFKRTKSTKEHDLSTLFFLVGLVLSLLIVITAFEWKFYNNGDLIELSGLNGDEFEDLIEIPPTDQPPPPPPVQNQPVVITEVNDDIEIEDLDLDLDVEVTEDMRISDPVPVVMEDLPEEEAEEIFVIVENKPEPKGGIQEFYKYLGENLVYPNTARSMNISGRVYVQFIVEKDGSLTNIEVVKGIGGGCDEEAVRVLSAAPAWNPGKQRGQPVKVRMTIPIHFSLQK